MKRDKCISCKHYEPFFNSCHLYVGEVYLGEGDYDIRPVDIKNISKVECNYMAKER